MELIREVLDNQIVDRNGQPMGKVDGLVIELRGNQPPRVVFLEVGGGALARRIHPRLGRWVAALGQRLDPRRGRPFRIPWALVRDVGIDVVVDADAATTPALAWEHWIRSRIVERIPGA